MRREKEKITVLVRATPEKSKKDGEGHAVGVTGINKDGEFLRLYPMRFRYGEGLVDFRRNDMLEVTVTRPENDMRRESRKVLDYVNLGRPARYREIKELILPLVTSLEKLNIEGASLGVIKPELLDIEVKINSLGTFDRQQYFDIMGDLLEKGEKAGMPVEIRYTFRCEEEEACRGHRIVLLDCELNETVRNIVREEKEPRAVKKRMREQLFEQLKEKELYFIMGTHFTYGTWLITGIFYPEKEIGNQKSIFDFRQKRTVSQMNKEQPALNR